MNDAETWDWELYPMGWYETVGFIGPQCGSWDRYIEADKKAREEAQSEQTNINGGNDGNQI